MTQPTLQWKDIRKLINELEEILMRLHVHLRNLEEKNKRYEKLHKKLGRKYLVTLNRKDKEQFRDYAQQYKFYQGKFYAYIFVLKQLGGIELPEVLERVRGIEWDPEGAWVKETKHHYSIGLVQYDKEVVEKPK